MSEDLARDTWYVALIPMGLADEPDACHAIGFNAADDPDAQDVCERLAEQHGQPGVWELHRLGHASLVKRTG